ncbi:MAG: enoyl-CoA hydratase-related protein [Actinomycetota bacterium]|nr:enoyl-CoA hydratase-related protein [Actinomycetota bacterium]
MGELVVTERREDGVELVTLQRPPMNALSAELLAELAEIAEGLGKDSDLKAVVVTGGDRVFAAGADIGQLQGPHGLLDSFRRAFDAVAAIPRPVIAAVAGYALGGGLELALACDLRVASETARLGVPEILLGLFPGAGGTQRLPRLIGPARAKDLLWSGRQVKPDEALAIGLVDKVVPAGAHLDAALEWAETFARGAVLAMGLSKRAVDGGLDTTLARGLDLEAEVFADAIASEDAAIGIQSFFEHGAGKAKFVGR